MGKHVQFGSGQQGRGNGGKKVSLGRLLTLSKGQEETLWDSHSCCSRQVGSHKTRFPLLQVQMLLGAYSFQSSSPWLACKCQKHPVWMAVFPGMLLSTLSHQTQGVTGTLFSSCLHTAMLRSSLKILYKLKCIPINNHVYSYLPESSFYWFIRQRKKWESRLP